MKILNFFCPGTLPPPGLCPRHCCATDSSAVEMLAFSPSARTQRHLQRCLVSGMLSCVGSGKSLFRLRLYKQVQLKDNRVLLHLTDLLHLYDDADWIISANNT